MPEFKVPVSITMGICAATADKARATCRDILMSNQDALEDMRVSGFEFAADESGMTYLQRIEMHLAAAVAVMNETALRNLEGKTAAFIECESPALRTVYESLKETLFPFPTKEQCEGVTLFKFRSEKSGEYAEHYSYEAARNEWRKSLMSPAKFHMSMFKEIELEAGSR